MTTYIRADWPSGSPVKLTLTKKQEAQLANGVNANDGQGLGRVTLSFYQPPEVPKFLTDTTPEYKAELAARGDDPEPEPDPEDEDDLPEEPLLPDDSDDSALYDD